MSQYVGKSISLVDTQNVRYIGVLSSISAETSTLVLENVTVYGTESRASGPDMVPEEAEPRARLEFKGSDVRDLQVLESEPTKHRDNTKSSKKSQASSTQKQSQQDKQTQSHEGEDENEDFIKRTQRLSLKGEEDGQVESTAAYDKSTSFFDTLGSEGSGRTSWAQERSLNMETFGEAGSNRNHVSGRGRGGHRGRGGYRGRGGFNRKSNRDTPQRNTQLSGEGDEAREHRRGPPNQSSRGRGRGNRRGSSRGESEPLTEFVPKEQLA